MDLNDFEKSLVRNLNQDGKDAIINLFITMMKDWEVSISYKASCFYYYVPQKDIVQQRKIPKTDLSNDSHEKQEINRYESYLQKLQEKIEESLHLIDLLTNAGLVIRYSLDIQDTFSAGKIPSACKDEQSTLYCIISKDKRDWAYLWNSLYKLFGTNIVILPALIEFENNDYKTSEELDRKKELRHLKFQTYIVAVGIFVSALFTLLAAMIAQPTSADIRAIADSINILTVKVDQITPNIFQPSQLDRPILTKINIDPTTSMQ